MRCSGNEDIDSESKNKLQCLSQIFGPVYTVRNEICTEEPTWVGLVMLAWDLGVCSSSRSRARLSPIQFERASLCTEEGLY